MGKAKILITDDDADIRDSLGAILESCDYDVVMAGDKDEGMAAVRNEKPDLIILDVMMSTWQDGFEMARELKQNGDFKDTPIVMLTGVKDKTGIDFKSSAGDPTWCPVDGFIDKPVQPDALLAEIKKHLGD